MAKGFKKPAELFQEKEPKRQISTRVPQSDYETLEKAAEAAGQSIAALSARVLEEYAAWLRNPK
jgi:predicted HicB family RNase H-like nuclease